MKTLLISFSFLLLVLELNAQSNVEQATTATAGKLAVTFATTSPGTEAYFAVYITNTSNTLVNTLYYRYGSAYKSQLTTFYGLIGSASPTTTNTKFVGAPDGVSGATISSATASKTTYWGQSATMAAAVSALADGNYKVNFEYVKNNNKRSYGSVIFAKGPATSAPVVPAITNFTGITVSWVPVNTAINDVEMEKLYSLYPNPAITSIYVSGNDINQVQICTLAGKIILTSKDQRINTSSLSKGFYLAVIYVNDKMVVKKFEKL